jgi:uncharacterized protein (DUF433 family)
MASRVVSLRLKEREMGRLERQARLAQRSVGETAASLLAEKLKQEEFPYIEFRPTVRGRRAYIKGSRLTVWQAVMVARDVEMDAQQVAEMLRFPVEHIQAALDYYAANRDEIDPILEEVDSMTYEKLRQILPNLQLS